MTWLVRTIIVLMRKTDLELGLFYGLSTLVFSLLNTYPNPFNPELNIDVSIENSGLLNVSVYNINGQHIETIYNDFASADNVYNLKWNASSNISSGMYIIQVVAPESTFSSIVNLLK